jgi:hypothetical protein
MVLPCLIGLNFAFGWACESTSLGVEINGPSERLFVLKKLDNLVKEKKVSRQQSNNDIVILSSSLGITSAAMTDSKEYGYPKLNSIDYMHYCGFRYLDEQIKKHTGQDVRTINFANSAMMICEQFLLLKELVRVGVKPKLVILEIAPRDFLDHWTAAYNRSRLAQILIMRQTPLAWQFDKSIAANVEIFCSKLWLFYSQRVEMKDYLVKIACEAFGRPATLFQAQVMQKMGIKPTPVVAVSDKKTDALSAEKAGDSIQNNIAKVVDAPPNAKTLEFSISDYRGRYLPLDKERWEQEFKAFEELLGYATDNKVPLLVVGMPLTKTNRELLPPDFLNEHRVRLVRKIGASPKIVILDLLDSNKFTVQDYIDTVHLRSTGGSKLAEEISLKACSTD